MLRINPNIIICILLVFSCSSEREASGRGNSNTQTESIIGSGKARHADTIKNNNSDTDAAARFLAALPDKSWRQIPNTKMTQVASDMFYDGKSTCCSFNIFAYSGAVKDDQRGLVYFWGGGHADYYGNEVYTFDLKSLTWKRLTDPSPKSFDECTSNINLHRLSDGQPKSRHTYDQMVFISHLNIMWAHGGSICGRGSGLMDLWIFDPATRQWTDLDPDLTWSWNQNLAMSSEYDPVTNKIYHFYANRIKAFDVDAVGWDDFSLNFFHPSERSAVLDPDTRKIVLYGGSNDSNRVTVFDIDSRTIATPGVPDELPKRRAPGWTFDSKNGYFIAYGGHGHQGRELWYYDVSTNNWFSETVPNGPDGNGFIYQRFVYDAANDVTFFFRTPYEDVWVLKNQNPDQ